MSQVAEPQHQARFPVAVAAHDCLVSDQELLSGAEFGAQLGGAIVVLVPAFNEERTLPELLPRVPSQLHGVPVAVLVVDDGSSDETTSRALDAGALVARLHDNHGGGAALRVGYVLAADHGAAIVATMDADGQHLPEELADLVQPIIDGSATFVQGSRKLGSSERNTLARTLGVNTFSRLVSRLTKQQVTDCSNGFRAIRTEVLPTLDLREQQFHAAEMLIEVITRGHVYAEIPITVRQRRHGKTKKPPTPQYAFGFARAILRSWLRASRRRELPATS